MTASDWVQVALALGGILVGCVVSWVFYRAQQQADFRSLQDSINTLAQHMHVLKEANRVTDRIDIQRDLTAMRSTIDSLNRSVGDLTTRILGEVKEQQRLLLETVSGQFDRQVASSRAVLEGAIARELGAALPKSPETANVVGKLIELVNHALHAMGQYQRETIATQSDDSFRKVQGNVVTAVGEIAADVRDIQARVAALPALLPPSPPS